MRERHVAVATVLLCLLLLTAGCLGLSVGGDGGEGDGESRNDGGQSDAEAGSLDGPHPHTEGDVLDPRALTSEHLATLRAEGAFRLTDTTTVRNVDDTSLRVRLITDKHVDLADERLLVELRRENPDGTSDLGQAIYQNATTSCTRYSGSVDCGDAAFDAGRALGRAVEITSLETVAAPAFSADGTTTVDGQAVYRYSASELRADPPEQALTELGQNATLESATLLVAPDGYVVRYDVTAVVDGESGRVRVERSYEVELVESGSLSPPAWVQT